MSTGVIKERYKDDLYGKSRHFRKNPGVRPVPL